MWLRLGASSRAWLGRLALGLAPFLGVAHTLALIVAVWLGRRAQLSGWLRLLFSAQLVGWELLRRRLLCRWRGRWAGVGTCVPLLRLLLAFVAAGLEGATLAGRLGRGPFRAHARGAKVHRITRGARVRWRVRGAGRPFESCRRTFLLAVRLEPIGVQEGGEVGRLLVLLRAAGASVALGHQEEGAVVRVRLFGSVSDLAEVIVCQCRRALRPRGLGLAFGLLARLALALRPRATFAFPR